MASVKERTYSYRGLTREPGYMTINACVRPDWVREVDAMAAAAGVTRSRVIKEGIELWIERERKRQEEAGG